MYIITLQGSPWENSASLFPNSTAVLATPVVWRKASTSKVLGFLLPFARLFVFIRLTPMRGASIPAYLGHKYTMWLYGCHCQLCPQLNSRRGSYCHRM